MKNRFFYYLGMGMVLWACFSVFVFAGQKEQWQRRKGFSKVMTTNLEVDKSSDSPFVLKDAQGKLIVLSNLKGKVVFLNFWATWCVPCRVEMPYIQKLYTLMSDHENLVFIMVDVDANPQKAERFLTRRKLNLPVYFPESPIPAHYYKRKVPTTVVLNKYGEVVFTHEGLGDFSTHEFKSFLEQLLAQ